MRFAIAAVLLVLTGCATWDQQISGSRPVPGLHVEVVRSGNVFWTVIVDNHSSSTAKLIWDESTYVSTGGQSTRLLRGQTRKIHSDQSQPPSPIPPGAHLSEVFTAEGFMPYIGTYTSPPPDDPSTPARIYLTFEVDGSKRTWEAAIRYVKRGGKN